jgi:hypothetical protein
MPPEIVALIDRPLLLLAVLAAGAVLGIAVERLVESDKRAERRAYWQGRKAATTGSKSAPGRRDFKAVPLKGTTERAALDAVEQLRLVMEASFRSRPLLNRPERRILAHLDKCLDEDAPGWRAMGQVSLGEILASEDPAAYFAINSKRVDLLIVDAECRPLHAIEFQGDGHHQGNAAARDAVKKEALRELRAIVRKLAGKQLALNG